MKKLAFRRRTAILSRGIRRNVFRDKIGAERAVDMALKSFGR